ncbi:MAG: hypothetical protein M3Q10_05600 [Chloroflexota bacterium]|nr:hypothetical protein [Chloroflexota bacterium]
MSKTDAVYDGGSTVGTPRWVKGFGIIALVLVLLFVVLQFAGGGGHGPGRHRPSGVAGGHAPPSVVTEDHAPSGGVGSHTPPEGGNR